MKNFKREEVTQEEYLLIKIFFFNNIIDITTVKIIFFGIQKTVEKFDD